MNDRPITNHDIEVKLHDYSLELDEAHAFLASAETFYHTTKAELEISTARAYLEIDHDRKIPVAEKESMVKVACADKLYEHAVANAKVAAARKNFERVKVQIDITRSQGSLIKASMELV